MTLRGTAETGKLGELFVISELVRREALVFTPVLDVKGIDAVVRRADGVLLKVQVKTHTTAYMSGWFDVPDLDSHPVNQFIIVAVNMSKYPPEETWVFPGPVFKRYSTKAGTNRGRTVYRLDLDARSKKDHNLVRRDILNPHYLNAWHILTG